MIQKVFVFRMSHEEDEGPLTTVIPVPTSRGSHQRPTEERGNDPYTRINQVSVITADNWDIFNHTAPTNFEDERGWEFCEENVSICNIKFYETILIFGKKS